MAPSLLQEITPARKQQFGVFYFPNTSTSPNEQLIELTLTLSYLKLLKSVLNKEMLQDKESVVLYIPVLEWIFNFREMLLEEKLKLLRLVENER